MERGGFCWSFFFSLFLFFFFFFSFFLFVCCGFSDLDWSS
jgi:hypothetical protein